MSGEIRSQIITARALLETADRCRTTSSTEFHQTLSFPSSVGKGPGLRVTAMSGRIDEYDRHEEDWPQ